MRKVTVNVLATTGLSLLVLSLIGMLSNAKTLYISSVFESLIVNILIHLWLWATQKMELSHVTVEIILDIGFIFSTLIVCGSIWQWFESTSIWMLAIMTVVIYFFSFLLRMLRIQQEVSEINELLHQRDYKRRS